MAEFAGCQPGHSVSKSETMQKYLGILTVFGFVVFGGIISPDPAHAVQFVCNVQKIPPIGVPVKADQFIKDFMFDSADVPSEASVHFESLRVSLQSNGKVITMKLSDSKRESVASISSFESEVRTRIGEEAEAFCFAEDLLGGAVPVEGALR